MAHLEEITVGCQLNGIAARETVTVIAVQWYGNAALEVTFKNSRGQLGSQILYRGDEATVDVLGDSLPWSFGADADKMRLVSEAYRIHLAHLFDPYLAVHTSAIQPLPHQITAVYQEISPDDEQRIIANVDKPTEIPEAALPKNPRDFKTPNYGMMNYSDLFTNRQLTALTTFSSLVAEAQAKAEADAVAAGVVNDHIALSAGGSGARAYGEAVGVYLAFLVDQLTNQSASVCGWNSVNTQMRCVFARQAIPMAWDYAECNVFSTSSGSYSNLLDRMIKAFDSLGYGTLGEVSQFDAQSDCGLRNIMVSTDPPYYDNIGYADLSDFFYRSNSNLQFLML